MVGVAKLPSYDSFWGMNTFSESNPEQSQTVEETPDIYIHAINPGYTIDGQSNVGELIEIRRTNPDDSTPISLAGIILGYTNTSGNSLPIFEFPDNVWMTGENVLLRLASSPGSELADLVYTKSIAMKAGPLELKRGETVLDSICWTSKDGCVDAFKSDHPTTLIHELKREIEPDEEILKPKIIHNYIHLENYEPIFSKDNPGLTYAEEEKSAQEENLRLDDWSAYENSENLAASSCTKLIFSEILSYYETSQSEQFIELYNPTSEQVLLNNCQIKYKNKLYPLEGIVEPDGYFIRLLTDFALTKNPTTKNTIELVNQSGQVASELTYYNGQKKSTSYAHIGYDEEGKPIWRSTFTPTPGAKNIYQAYKPCEEGRVLNEETGNCVKPTQITEKTCKEGYYLNEDTGRCNKISSATTEEKVCKEGYYLNPLTNRCKKLVVNNGADYALKYEKTDSSTSSFVALGAIIVLIFLTIGFIILEFRKEIKNCTQKVFHRLFHREKDSKRED